MIRLKFGKQHAMDYWPKFKEIDLGLSIDGVEKDIEIIRWGTKWNDVVANIKEIQKYQPDRFVGSSSSAAITWDRIFDKFDKEKTKKQKRII